MIPRDQIIALITEIKKCPAGVEDLDRKDWNFLNDMTVASSKYGYAFSEKQSKWLQEIYRKVYANL
jgi:hypothetical protein